MGAGEHGVANLFLPMKKNTGKQGSPPKDPNEGHDPQPNKDFTMVSDKLVRLGVPLREAMLYGRLAFHGGKAGRWFTTWAKLAEEIGVRHRITVYRLLLRLRERRLVTWKRHDQYSNLYQVHVPDVAFLQRQRLQGCNVSEVAETQPKIESIGVLEEEKKNAPLPPNTPPSPKPDRKTDDCASDDARGVRTPISRKGVVSAATAAATGLFEEFIGVFLAAGKKLNKLDNERARKLWLHFDAPEHGRILEHLKRSVTDGTWSSERYIPMPANYLESKAWTRIGPGRVLPLPPRSESKTESALRRAAERFRQGER